MIIIDTVMMNFIDRKAARIPYDVFTYAFPTISPSPPPAINDAAARRPHPDMENSAVDVGRVPARGRFVTLFPMTSTAMEVDRSGAKLTACRVSKATQVNRSMLSESFCSHARHAQSATGTCNPARNSMGGALHRLSTQQLSNSDEGFLYVVEIL